MSHILVIVESAGKIKKIQNILDEYDNGKYHVVASVGHIMDLNPDDMSIDISNGFKPIYIINKDKHDVVKNIKHLHKKSTDVLIATDEDREGEMIAWSIKNVLNLSDPVKRICFNSITKDAIIYAVNNPKNIDNNLVCAQQARRILDRLIGYEVSPILQKVLCAQSAGRVQSVVVKILLDKEKDIKTFMNKKNEGLYVVHGLFDDNKAEYLNNDKITNDTNIKDLLEQLMKQIYKITNVKFTESVSKPSAPFTTSSLQQEAYNVLGMSVSKTMKIAQSLYEAGLITYMRTDSVSICKEALNDIETYICKTFGDKYHKLTHYKSKSHSQEAHEAIRPTNINTTQITGDNARLYELIWKRTISSQMTECVYDVKTVYLNDIFMFQIKSIKNIGYMHVYKIKQHDNDKYAKYSVGQIIDLEELSATQTYTHPPHRYNEASLIKQLDNLGIGRPSTYATTIKTIQERNYVETRNSMENEIKTMKANNYRCFKDNIVTETQDIKIGYEQNKLFCTDLGIKVTKYLIDKFDKIVDTQFTADLEQKLDDISTGKLEMTKTMQEFYDDFHPKIEQLCDAKKENTSVLIGIHTENKCEIFKDIGKYGPYVHIKVPKQKLNSAPIREPYNYETITVEQAMDILKYPIKIGTFERKKVELKKGKYGLYISWAKENINVKHEVSIEEAIEMIKEKNNKYIHTDTNGTKYMLMNGVYGKYLCGITKTGKKTNYKINDNIDTTNMSESVIMGIVNQPKKRYIKLKK